MYDLFIFILLKQRRELAHYPGASNKTVPVFGNLPMYLIAMDRFVINDWFCRR